LKRSAVRHLHAALPQMNDDTFLHPDVGHFIEEHEGEEIVRSIRAMIRVAG
jgi:hypothetical protein